MIVRQVPCLTLSSSHRIASHLRLSPSRGGLVYRSSNRPSAQAAFRCKWYGKASGRVIECRVRLAVLYVHIIM